MFTHAAKTLENHDIPPFLCQTACHRLLNKFSQLSHVLIVKFMDESVMKKHYKLNPLATNQWVLGQYHPVSFQSLLSNHSHQE